MDWQAIKSAPLKDTDFECWVRCGTRRTPRVFGPGVRAIWAASTGNWRRRDSGNRINPTEWLPLAPTDPGEGV